MCAAFTTKPNIYVPGLPDLSSDDFDLYKKIHETRIDLTQQVVDAGMRLSSIDRTDSWLKNMLHNAASADAFLFPPLTSMPEKHPHFKAEAAQRWFEFFSITTGVHIGTHEKYGKDGFSKPCVMMDPDGQWASTVDLLRDLHAKGMFTSDVEDIVQLVPDADKLTYHEMNQKAVEMLGRAIADEKAGKARKTVPKKYPEDRVFEPFRKDDPNDKTRLRHPFGIAFFGSASTTEESYIKASSDLARMAGERGWRMSSGAGNEGVMGAADRGYREGAAEFNRRYPRATYKPGHIGVSTQDILRIEGPPENLDQLIITDDIYDRIKVMIKGQLSEDPRSRTRDTSKVIFVAPGGVGTVQEFATLMDLAFNGSMMEGRKVVLLDVPSHLNSKEGFWDPLIKIAEKLNFRNHFEVANSPEEAIQIADNHYLEWQKTHPEFRNLPHPVLNRNPAAVTRAS
jgi:predicted Rossmann-fold nucleotide-binding protein